MNTELAPHPDPAAHSGLSELNDAKKVAETDGSGETAAALERLGERLEVIATEDTEELLDRAVEEGNRVSRALARQGYYLLAARERLPHGEFQAACTARHIPPRRARESMRVTRLLIAAEAGPGKMTNAVVKRLLDLRPTKLEALARIDPETFAELDERQAWDLIDDVDCMPVDMLRREMRKLRGKDEQRGAQIRSRDLELEQWRRADGVAVAGSEYPASVTRTRSEAAVLSDQALARIGAIRRLADELPRSPDLGERRSERAVNFAAAARPLYLHAASVYAAAGELLKALEHDLADWLPDDWNPEAQPAPLSVEEAHRLTMWRETHLRRMEGEAVLREDGRVHSGEIKRGRGRPRKPPQSEPASRRPRGRPKKAGR